MRGLLHLDDETVPLVIPAKQVHTDALLTHNIRFPFDIQVIYVFDYPLVPKDDVEEVDEEIFVFRVSQDRLEASIGQACPPFVQDIASICTKREECI